MTEETITQLQLGGLQVIQARKGYRFSIDSILLCAFAEIAPRARVADLGTGSGIIPLLLHHSGKGEAFLGIERQLGLADRARRTVALNGLQCSIEIVHADVCRLSTQWQGGFDAVVSNPPYRKPSSGRVALDDERAAARHEIAGEMRDFLQAASFLLKRGGVFYLVYLAERLAELLAEMRLVQLEPKRLRLVHPREGEPANLVLVEGRKHGRSGLKVEPPLIVYQGAGRDYSPEVLAMYQAKIP